MAAVYVQIGEGKLVGETTGEVHSFKGIPFGEDTGGANRFCSPLSKKPWSGERQATSCCWRKSKRYY